MNYFFLCALGFCASFVDAIAGGGGLISLPGFLIAGIPAHIALGTNKFSASTAAVSSAVSFIKNKKVNFEIVKYYIPLTLIGAVAGVRTVLIINSEELKPLVTILIISVCIYTLFSKNLGISNNYHGKTKTTFLLGAVLALALGFYDGFFGPGTGSFLIFGLMYIFKFDFLQANGNAKILNLVSNVASLVTFALAGQVDYHLGILVAVFMVLGSQAGSRLAIKNGTKLIKPVFLVMSLCVAVKMLVQ